MIPAGVDGGRLLSRVRLCGVERHDDVRGNRILVFTSVLLLGHLIFDRRDTFFLDVACISQDDEKLKASGIASLGAILDRSERMLVLCDGNYFSRLWCCA